MPSRCCACCVFVGRVHRGDPGELICVNCPVALGEPVRVQPDGVCKNFRAKGDRASSCARTAVLPVPPNDKICYIPLTKKTICMHREIMQPPPGKVTDHISGYRLDNRRENLRNYTQGQNVRNSRGHGASSGTVRPSKSTVPTPISTCRTTWSPTPSRRTRTMRSARSG